MSRAEYDAHQRALPSEVRRRRLQSAAHAAVTAIPVGDRRGLEGKGGRVASIAKSRRLDSEAMSHVRTLDREGVRRLAFDESREGRGIAYRSPAARVVLAEMVMDDSMARVRSDGNRRPFDEVTELVVEAFEELRSQYVDTGSARPRRALQLRYWSRDTLRALLRHPPPTPQDDTS